MVLYHWIICYSNGVMWFHVTRPLYRLHRICKASAIKSNGLARNNADCAFYARYLWSAESISCVQLRLVFGTWQGVQLATRNKITWKFTTHEILFQNLQNFMYMVEQRRGYQCTQVHRTIKRSLFFLTHLCGYHNKRPFPSHTTYVTS